MKPISGCLGCAQCIRKGPNGEPASLRCFIDDAVNEFLDKAEKADGFVFGSPVHYAALSGALTSFMDRAFYGKGSIFRYKPAAGIVSARRGGTTAAFDQINKYFTISSMPVVSSKYWNMVHGNTPDEVKQDLEGMQNMRAIGRNMAWLLKCIEAGKAAGIPLLRILAPLIVLSGVISVAAFFASNNLIPVAYEKIYSLRDDIGKTREEIKIPTGVFYNGIDGYTLRVVERDENNMMHNVMVYDHSKNNGNISVTVADSGIINMSSDKTCLTFTLYNGTNYEETNTKQKRDTTLA
mgnify:CR=1 FL=1